MAHELLFTAKVFLFWHFPLKKRVGLSALSVIARIPIAIGRRSNLIIFLSQQQDVASIPSASFPLLQVIARPEKKKFFKRE
jgi:hypothetical protein